MLKNPKIYTILPISNLHSFFLPHVDIFPFESIDDK